MFKLDTHKHGNPPAGLGKLHTPSGLSPSSCSILFLIGIHISPRTPSPRTPTPCKELSSQQKQVHNRPQAP